MQYFYYEGRSSYCLLALFLNKNWLSLCFRIVWLICFQNIACVCTFSSAPIAELSLRHPYLTFRTSYNMLPFSQSVIWMRSIISSLLTSHRWERWKIWFFTNCFFSYKPVDAGFYYSTFYSWLIGLFLRGLLLPEKYFLLAAYETSSVVINSSVTHAELKNLLSKILLMWEFNRV